MFRREQSDRASTNHKKYHNVATWVAPCRQTIPRVVLINYRSSTIALNSCVVVVVAMIINQ